MKCSMCKKEDNDSYWIEKYGVCCFCHIEQEKQRRDNLDREEAKEEGSISRENSIMCPYCGYLLEDDWYEYVDSDEFCCPECEEISELESDINYTIKTWRK